MDKIAKNKAVQQHGPSGFIYFVAWVGALVYFVNQASGFWAVVLAFLKACVWPAFLMYHVLQALKIS